MSNRAYTYISLGTVIAFLIAREAIEAVHYVRNNDKPFLTSLSSQDLCSKNAHLAQGFNVGSKFFETAYSAGFSFDLGDVSAITRAIIQL